MAAGICAGDWERIEETWDFHRYHAIHEHWLANGPPPYIGIAALAGFKPKAPRSAEVVGGDDLANMLTVFPGGASGATPMF